uniref:F-box domain-containing protein n=1 Tax=viral metagenome TaxID=1070528 RepID=A0A6C0LX73_9ZZZZ
MLPYDIILEISDFIPFYLNKNLFISNKFFFELYKEKYLKNINFIQNTYRKYKLPNDFLSSQLFFSYRDYCKWQKIFNKYNKVKIYRYVLVKYNLEDIRYFPESLLNKACVMHSSRYLIIKDWVENNLIQEKSKRTRRDILDFFIKNRIRLKEVLFVGF